MHINYISGSYTWHEQSRESSLPLAPGYVYHLSPFPLLSAQRTLLWTLEAFQHRKTWWLSLLLEHQILMDIVIWLNKLQRIVLIVGVCVNFPTDQLCLFIEVTSVEVCSISELRRKHLLFFNLYVFLIMFPQTCFWLSHMFKQLHRYFKMCPIECRKWPPLPKRTFIAVHQTVVFIKVNIEW